MTDNELIENIKTDIDLPESEVKNLMKIFTDTISERLNNEDIVSFPNIGTFYVEKVEEKISFNKETKIKTLVPPQLVVKYKKSEILKQKINLKS